MESRISVNSVPRKHPASSGMLSDVRKIAIILLLAGFLVLAGFYLLRFINSSGIPSNVAVPLNNQIEPKPVRIIIGAINVDAPTPELGLNSDGTLAVPQKDEEVGWYKASPVPGAIGPAIMVGHLDSVRGPAVFQNLKNLKAGDLVKIKREDGSMAIFKVETSQAYSQDNFPTDKVYGAIDYAGIRLITCSGTYSRLKGHYSDNLVVFGKLVSVK